MIDPSRIPPRLCTQKTLGAAIDRLAEALVRVQGSCHPATPT